MAEKFRPIQGNSPLDISSERSLSDPFADYAKIAERLVDGAPERRFVINGASRGVRIWINRDQRPGDLGGLQDVVNTLVNSDITLPGKLKGSQRLSTYLSVRFDNGEVRNSVFFQREHSDRKKSDTVIEDQTELLHAKATGYHVGQFVAILDLLDSSHEANQYWRTKIEQEMDSKESAEIRSRAEEIIEMARADGKLIVNERGVEQALVASGEYEVMVGKIPSPTGGFQISTQNLQRDSFVNPHDIEEQVVPVEIFDIPPAGNEDQRIMVWSRVDRDVDGDTIADKGTVIGPIIVEGQERDEFKKLLAITTDDLLSFPTPSED